MTKHVLTKYWTSESISPDWRTWYWRRWRSCGCKPSGKEGNGPVLNVLHIDELKVSIYSSQPKEGKDSHKGLKNITGWSCLFYTLQSSPSNTPWFFCKTRARCRIVAKLMSLWSTWRGWTCRADTINVRYCVIPHWNRGREGEKPTGRSTGTITIGTSKWLECTVGEEGSGVAVIILGIRCLF